MHRTLGRVRLRRYKSSNSLEVPYIGLSDNAFANGFTIKAGHSDQWYQDSQDRLWHLRRPVQLWWVRQ